MRLEKVSLGIIAVVALVVLAVPFWRGLALSQLRQIVPGSEKTVWTGNVDPSMPSPHPRTDSQLLKEHPDDFLLHLALAEKQTIPSRGIHKSTMLAKQAVQTLLRDYPKQGAAYSLAWDLSDYAKVRVPRRIEGVDVLPEEAMKDWHDPGPPTKEQLDGCRRCIDLLDKAITADPGNGWFHFHKAAYLYGLHRDTEAQSQIHQAALAPRFTDCTDLSGNAWDHLCDLRGAFDPIHRAGVKAMLVRYGTLTQARESARITAHLAYARIRRGDTGQGIRIVEDLTASGYNMARNAPTIIHGLVGKAVIAIGAHALDPTYDPKKKDARAERAAKLARYNQFLISHGYSREATALNKQWRQTDLMVDRVKAFVDSDLDSYVSVMMRFESAFVVAGGIIATAILLAVGWAGASILTARNGGRTFWDSRAGVTSALLSLLILAPVIAHFVRPPRPDAMQKFYAFGWPLGQQPVRPVFLLIPLALMALAMVAGLVMMFRRTPQEGENRRMPVWALLAAYLAGFGGVAYLAYGLDDFAVSSGFFDSLRAHMFASMILGPAVLLTLYALLRAAQSRFGRVRRSGLLTFVATMRYGSAIAVGICAVAYLCMMPPVAHLGASADAFARDSFTMEATVIRTPFK